MIICKYQFNQPDSKNPNYSFDEIDYYAWIPAGSEFPNHRLSLRKNLITGDFEVYRRFQQGLIFSRKTLTISTNVDSGGEEVVFKSSDLGKAIEFASGEYLKYHGDRMGDQVCQHKSPVKAMFCKGDL